MESRKKKKIAYEDLSLEKVAEIKADELAIQSTMDLESITMKAKRWQIRMYIRSILPRSYRGYKVSLSLDESPYLERIKEKEVEFDSQLFKNDKIEKKKHHESIKEMRTQLEKMRDDCEKIDFTAVVDELKYKDGQTSLLMQVPDDVIEPFNRQKTRFEIYKVILTPII